MPFLFNRMKQSRLDEGLSQAKMAEILGVSQQAYWSFEVGKRTPNIEMAVKIADVLNLSLDYLTGRSERPRINGAEDKLEL